MANTIHTPLLCDIFCTVIDNYGDIATCWRLAHILHHDHGMPVRLFVDNLDALKPLTPATQNRAQQILHGIDVRHWTADMADIPPAPSLSTAATSCPRGSTCTA